MQKRNRNFNNVYYVSFMCNYRFNFALCLVHTSSSPVAALITAPASRARGVHSFARTRVTISRYKESDFSFSLLSFEKRMRDKINAPKRILTDRALHFRGNLMSFNCLVNLFVSRFFHVSFQ